MYDGQALETRASYAEECYIGIDLSTRCIVPQLIIRVSDGLHDRLTTEAAAQEMPISTYARNLLVAGLKRDAEADARAVLDAIASNPNLARQLKNLLLMNT
jgi:predicted HicB family RNase H-like nuclease